MIQTKIFRYSYFFVLTLFINLVLRGPDLIKYLTTPPNYHFAGQASWFDPWDTNVYFSAIGWGQRGNTLLFPNLYDTQNTQSMPIYPAYTILGFLSRPFHLSPPLVFHLSAALLTPVIVIVLWWFIKLFFIHDNRLYPLHFLLCLGGGLGGLVYPKLLLPDIIQPGFTLESAFRRPHETISLIAFLVILGSTYHYLAKPKIKTLIPALVGFPLLLFSHPYQLLPLAIPLGLLGVYYYLHHRLSFNTLVLPLFLFGTLLLGYLAITWSSLISNPAFSGLLQQVQSSPSPLSAILAWGILSPLIVTTILFVPKTDKIKFLLTWFAIQWFAIYLPFGFQKLLIRGLWIVATLLAFYSIDTVCAKLKIKTNFVLLVICFFMLSSPFLTFFRIITEPVGNIWIYRTSQESQLWTELSSQGYPDQGVLASYPTSNIIPSFTNKRVWFGHAFQTPNFINRQHEVSDLYQGKLSPSELTAFLSEANIGYIVWGPFEQAIANSAVFPYSASVSLVYSNPTFSLYQTR